MAFVYTDVDDLEETAKVGSKQCVALVQHYALLPNTSLWRAGPAALGNLTIAKGTAIATFVNGRYASNSTGNHAAFYVSQDAQGMWIMDQWVNDVTKPRVSKRYIHRKESLPKRGFVDPSNNADAYSVIELQA